MRNLVTQHPEDGVLLRYIDGELPGRKLRQVERHLKACWQCRTEVKDLESTVAGCVRYRQNVLQAHLPDPPNPWPDLYPEFARLDSSASGEFHRVASQLAARLVAILGSAGVRRWAAAAAAALVMVCVIWYQFRETPSVQAAVLLKRAVLAAEAQPTPARRIQVRTKTETFTRTIGSRQAHGNRRPDAAEASAAPIRARFEAAHYDWDDPLSAKSYQAWRDSVARSGSVSRSDAVPAIQDEVATVPDPQSPALSCYRIRTSAAEGELATASLVLRIADLRPLEERLEFRDREWVELTDITDATTRDDGASVAAHVEPPVRPVVPSRPAATLSGPASISDELQVLAALHEIGADLGDPVEVSLADGRVVVGGVGIPARRQEQIHGLLDAKPNVAVQFSEPEAGHSVPAESEPPAAPPAGATSTSSGLQARVEQQLGGQAEFERFSSQVLDRDESLMSRAYALRRLAELFPTDAGLAAKDREVLRTMARQNAVALAGEVSSLDRALAPLLASLGASAPSRTAPAATSWQPAAEELARASHRLEVLVSVLLGVTPGNTPAARLPSDLSAALGEVRADVDSCLHSLAP